jgi:hypothetical protein
MLTKEEQAEQYAKLIYPESKGKQICAIVDWTRGYDSGHKDGYSAREKEEGWVSVEERLPEVSTIDEFRAEILQSDDVLVWEKDRVYFGSYHHQHKGSWSVYGRMGGIEVTHWKRITSPNKEGR